MVGCGFCALVEVTIFVGGTDWGGAGALLPALEDDGSACGRGGVLTGAVLEGNVSVGST